MLIHPRGKDRAFHLGPFPLETLLTDASVLAREAAQPPLPATPDVAADGPLGRAADHYRQLFAKLADGTPAAQQAPVPDDRARRSVDIKGAAYFLETAQAGICRVPDNAWRAGGDHPRHEFAVVLLVERPRLPETDNLARDWVAPARDAVADMRAAEIAVCIAGHIRTMGFAARAHFAGHDLTDRERLAVLAGLAVRSGEGLRNPYLDDFSIAVVTTDYALATDLPLHDSALAAKGLAYWFGIAGAQSGRERNRRNKRATHLSRYPMETVKRIARPTTLILDDEVPRVPKRAAFFQRALHGDLGDKAKAERTRFAFKTPLSFSLLQLIRALVPFQGGDVSPQTDRARYRNARENARAIKSLSYALGSDLTGICDIPRYAWFSHKEDGTEIKPYHRSAVVMLIDQGYDTMEAASGDDWISGSQSMRGYLRGAVIAGIMAEMLRELGFAARSQTNADSDVLHIPLILWAGLGELSRIGELVLNPFVGPRFKSVVMTTDFPLEPDQPIDFGLQTFCQGCLKCARECPCDAIPFGDKVMFNGYEIWKPDVERCTRYRLTNARGSACGRCMKTCPINKVVDADGALLTRAASWLGVNAMWLKPVMVPFAAWFDDWIGNGRRNPAKRWWLDHEIVGGVTVAAKGTNQRDIDPTRQVDPAAAMQKMAYHHANMMPPPNDPSPLVVDRKAGMAAKALLETPDQARTRKAAGGPLPAHYVPVPPIVADTDVRAAKSPYD
ncbi:MAG: reductive dehalogenase domain-containing protein [Pseudolabrys sp.]|nr:reductive dehalogenase domain-containing protein [Pseudolabrys sp.]